MTLARHQGRWHVWVWVWVWVWEARLDTPLNKLCGAGKCSWPGRCRKRELGGCKLPTEQLQVNLCLWKREPAQSGKHPLS